LGLIQSFFSKKYRNGYLYHGVVASFRKKYKLDKLKVASSIVAKTLKYLQENITVGMTLKEIDAMGEEFIRSQGAEPSFKGLYGFPASVCTSLNEVCIHGVPTDVKT